MITGIITAAALVGGTGLVIGLLLGLAGKKFAVEVNEKEIAVREQLPGNNCGGCGYPGCDGLSGGRSGGGEGHRSYYGPGGDGRPADGGLCKMRRRL